ncbi:hypothetical protein [Aeromicrobium sp. Leaf245]|uniref:hypothetical protein n=1 Tax=Aeromicrobium sp. Leaf245 TaxID=1736306 RepID=UPI0006FD522C|nr:hypothetical protein [Aeromicrobium sp. Leaf245]KQO41845.1 hypothetical protein ASF05_12115 [Aeromicrobium sp. Leaf245]
MNTFARATAVAVLTCGLLTACTGGDDDKADDKKTAAKAADKQTTSPQDLPEVPEIEDFEGALKDVTLGACPTEKGSNSVKGKVKNSTDDEQDYVITISWITARSDVVARGVATIEDLGAGDTEDWTIKGSPIAASGTYTCTTQVQRGEL